MRGVLALGLLVSWLAVSWSCLGAYPVDSSGFWTPPDYWEVDDIALEISDHPKDGSREDVFFYW